MKENKNDNSHTKLVKKTFWVRLQEEKYVQFMAICGVIWMIIFNYIPMYGLLIAFKKNFYITTPLFSLKFFKTPWATNHGFQHFLAFFKDEEFVNIYLLTHKSQSKINVYRDFLILNKIKNGKN